MLRRVVITKRGYRPIARDISISWGVGRLDMQLREAQREDGRLVTAGATAVPTAYMRAQFNIASVGCFFSSDMARPTRSTAHRDAVLGIGRSRRSRDFPKITQDGAASNLKTYVAD